MDTSLVAVLGGELITTDGFPSTAPGTGQQLSLCSLHAQLYDARSRNDHCQTIDCCRRGFSLTHSGSTFVTCAVNLQEKLTELSVQKVGVIVGETVPVPLMPRDNLNVCLRRGRMRRPTVSQMTKRNIEWRKRLIWRHLLQRRNPGIVENKRFRTSSEQNPGGGIQEEMYAMAYRINDHRMYTNHQRRRSHDANARIHPILV